MHGGQSGIFPFVFLSYSTEYPYSTSLLSPAQIYRRGLGTIRYALCCYVPYRYERKTKEKIRETLTLLSTFQTSPYSAPHDYAYRLTLRFPFISIPPGVVLLGILGREMTVSPPGSPTGAPPRPISAVMRTPRSTSRLSMSSRQGGSRASDEDGKTAVKVGMWILCDTSPDRPPNSMVTRYLAIKEKHNISQQLNSSLTDCSCPCATTIETNRSWL